MYYMHFPWNLRLRSTTWGVAYEPVEAFRAWAWEHHIRYTLRRVRYTKNGREDIAMWIGFYNDNDAFAYRMRWS